MRPRPAVRPGERHRGYEGSSSSQTSRLMNTARRIAQIVLAAAPIGAAGAAAILYLGRGPEALFGERVLTTPAKGPVGMRMFLEPRSFPADRRTSIYLCPAATGSIKDCIALATVAGPQRVQAR